MKALLIAIALALMSPLVGAAAPKNTGDVTLAKIGKTYPCSIVRAVDGDTLDAKCAILGTVRIRVADIDTPERGQPFYKEATAFAEVNAGAPNKMINAIVVNVQPATERYEARMVARVYDTKRGSYAKKVAAAGLGWSVETSPGVVKEAHSKAKKEKLGLWSQPDPIAPWDFRAGKRPAVDLKQSS